MPRARITWSPAAIRHFSNWIGFIARDSVATAKRQRDKILKAVLRLKSFPLSGRIVPEFANPSLREIIMKPVRIIYRIQENEVRVLALHHSKRQLDVHLFS